MGTKLSEQKALALLEENLKKYAEISLKDASPKDLYKALAMICQEMLLEKREKFNSKCVKSGAKKVHYLCMEFLLGRNLKSTLFNLNIDNAFSQVLQKNGFDIEDVYEVEADAGLGNGGLGRLAACFMDSLATLSIPSMGHSILYEYGLFKQKIVDGEQIELTDNWRHTGDVWLQKRRDRAVIVRFGGIVKENNINGRLIPEYEGCTEVQAIPYDMILSGYDSNGVANLRLWEAKSVNQFDLNSFSQGAYVQAVADASKIEMISKVLYPADDHNEGKTLRLEQQYFLVSASLQNIVSSHLRKYRSLKNLSNYITIHINDTHPALSVPELMRILMDDHGWGWDSAWQEVNKIIAYTNHTVLMEALEKWDENLFKTTLPRIYQIVKEINRRFTKELFEDKDERWDINTIEKMSIISGNQVRMANLSIVGGYKVNGVSKLHSDIIKNNLFRNFSNLYPEKFTNITNGIAHRRWLCQSNPNLTQLIDSSIGEGYYTKPDELEGLLKFAEDKTFLNKIAKIKQKNKKEFAEYLKKTQGVKIDPNMRFDVHVKRIHEYKRQLLNVLKIIHLYITLKDNPQADVTPQVFFFGGKSASKYYMAKRIIKLICKLSQDIDKNELVRDKLRVVFLENYNVSLAEKIIPATDVSEQISLAGKEASGTGNMKFMINGALTLGTYDGANVEMCECVGRDNIFIFGLSSDEVDNEWKKGYSPKSIYESNSKVNRVIEELRKGFDGEKFDDIARYLIDGGRPDPYMCLIDFESYLEAHERMDKVYRNPSVWNAMVVNNIAKAGFFAADRSIEDYAEGIWKIKPVK